MLLRVQYNTGEYDMVKDAFLDSLIASARIVKFHRSSGWVFIDRDRIRRNGDGYEGPERRAGKRAAAA